MAEHGAIHVRRAYCNAEVGGQATRRCSSGCRCGRWSTCRRGKNAPTSRWPSMPWTWSSPSGRTWSCIVSSDSDFAPLVIRLREKGCRVDGFGQQGKTGAESHARATTTSSTCRGPTAAGEGAEPARARRRRRERARAGGRAPARPRRRRRATLARWLRRRARSSPRASGSSSKVAAEALRKAAAAVAAARRRPTARSGSYPGRARAAPAGASRPNYACAVPPRGRFRGAAANEKAARRGRFLLAARLRDAQDQRLTSGPPAPAGAIACRPSGRLRSAALRSARVFVVLLVGCGLFRPSGRSGRRASSSPDLRRPWSASLRSVAGLGRRRGRTAGGAVAGASPAGVSAGLRARPSRP